MAKTNSTRKPIKTELQLSNLRPEDSPYEVKVEGSSGLKIRVSITGAKSFRWDRGRGNTPRIITYGKYPSLKLAKARQQHEKMRQQHADGLINVIDTTVNTVAELAEIFYKDRIVPRRRRPDIVKQGLDCDILPQIGQARLTSISPMIVRSVVMVVIDRGSNSQADRVLAILKQLFRFGVSLGVMESNPAESLDRIDLGIDDSHRDRVLSNNEIKLFWDAMEQTQRISLQIRVALRLLLLLGIRSGELRKAQWQHIDLEKRLLTIPVANQKLSYKQERKAKPFSVPFDTCALELFMQLRGFSDTWVFTGASDNMFHEKSMTQALTRLRGYKIKGERLLPIDDNFTPHDLRRTMRSNLSKLNVPPHIAERCLNHSLGRILETYDTHDYLDERREALEKWSQRLQVILGKHENVVELEKVG